MSVCVYIFNLIKYVAEGIWSYLGIDEISNAHDWTVE